MSDEPIGKNRIPKTADPPLSTPEFIERWFSDKSEADLEARALGHRMYYPETLRTRGDDKQAHEDPIMISVPTTLEKVRAVLDANERIAELAKIPADKRPITRAQAEELSSPEFYVGMLVATTLSYAIRNPDPPYDRAYSSKLILDAGLPPAVMSDMYQKLQVYEWRDDIRVGELTPEWFDAIVCVIARTASISPLADCVGSVSEACIVQMAREIQRLRSELAQLQASSTASSSTSTAA